MNNSRPTKNLRPKILATLLLTSALVVVGGSAAHAEGRFNSTMTQVQPSFQSRTWTDNANDNLSTIISLTNCKANVGGKVPGSLAISSVTIEMTRIRNGDTKYSKTQACGNYNFANQGSGRYLFRVAAINGYKVNDGKRFLNATVSVTY